MTPSFLPGMSHAEQKREKVRRRVRPTSRAQYADGRERFKGRRANVLRWLAAAYNLYQSWPTSAELAQFSEARARIEVGIVTWDALVLYVRRGLSDLQTSGVSESVSERMCVVTGRKCCVWRIR